MGTALTKKIGPFPVWSLVLAGGLGVAWYIRKQRAANAAATDTSATTDTTSTVDPGFQASGTDAGTVGALGDPNAVQGGFVDTSGNEALISALYDQIGAISGAVTDLAGVVDANAHAPAADGTAAPVPVTAPAPTGGDGAGTSTGTTAHRSVAATGIVKQAKLKNGAILTTFADGRVEEQVPGKTAYIVKKATKKAPTRMLAAHSLYIADAPVGYGVGYVSPVSAAPMSAAVVSSGPPPNEAYALLNPTAPAPAAAAPSNVGVLNPEQLANNPGIGAGPVIDPGFYTWSGVPAPTHSPAVLPPVYTPGQVVPPGKVAFV